MNSPPLWGAAPGPRRSNLRSPRSRAHECRRLRATWSLLHMHDGTYCQPAHASAGAAGDEHAVLDDVDSYAAALDVVQPQEARAGLRRRREATLPRET